MCLPSSGARLWTCWLWHLYIGLPEASCGSSAFYCPVYRHPLGCGRNTVFGTWDVLCGAPEVVLYTLSYHTSVTARYAETIQSHRVVQAQVQEVLARLGVSVPGELERGSTSARRAPCSPRPTGGSCGSWRQSRDRSRPLRAARSAATRWVRDGPTARASRRWGSACRAASPAS